MSGVLNQFLTKTKNRVKSPQDLLRPRVLFMLVLLLFCLAIIPLVYQESWLSPFTTLGIPNRYFHPHAFSAVGYIDATDPSHPRSAMDRALTQELLRDLEEAQALPASQNQPISDQEPVLHFVLHRDASHFHSAADFALTYYPNLVLLRFGGQEFHVNQATELLLDSLPNKLKVGWWSAK